MTVTSQELPKDKTVSPLPAARPATLRSDAQIAGLILLGVGTLAWVAGGRYTVEGWTIWLNWFFVWLHAPIVLASPTGWWLLIILPVAYAYSRVEVAHRPLRYNGKRWSAAAPHLWAAWAIVVATDVGSTFMGVRVPGEDAWRLTREVAASPALAFIWATVLTFLPEWLMIGGKRLLGR